MVMVEDYPKLTVTVEVNHEPAKEYNSPHYRKQDDWINDDDYTLTVVRYIEAKPDQEYRVRIVRESYWYHRGHHLYFQVQIDGFAGGPGKSDEQWRETAKDPFDATIHSFFHQPAITTRSQRNQYNFIFWPLEIQTAHQLTGTELREAPKMAEEVGTIKVLCFYENLYGENTEERSSMPKPPNCMPLVTTEALGGRATDCYTSFADVPHLERADTRKYGGYILVSFHDRAKRPFAIYKFRYRTEAGLVKELGSDFRSTAVDPSKRTVVDDAVRGSVPSPTVGLRGPTMIDGAVDLMVHSELRQKVNAMLKRRPALAAEEVFVKESWGRQAHTDNNRDIEREGSHSMTSYQGPQAYTHRGITRKPAPPSTPYQQLQAYSHRGITQDQAPPSASYHEPQAQGHDDIRWEATSSTTYYDSQGHPNRGIKRVGSPTLESERGAKASRSTDYGYTQGYSDEYGGSNYNGY